MFGKLDAKEGGGVGRERAGQGGPDSREEAGDALRAVDAAGDLGHGGLHGGRLLDALDGVDRKDCRPHGDAGAAAGHGDGAEGELVAAAAQVLLHVLVRGEVRGGAGPVPGQGGGGALVDRAEPALLVQRAHRLQERRLRLVDLHHHLDALERRRNERRRDGAEEACGADLGYREGHVRRLAPRAHHQPLPEVVSPERHGEHRRHPEQRRRHALVEPERAVVRHNAPDRLGCRRVLVRLQKHLCQIKRVAREHCTHPAKSSCRKRLHVVH